jgi:hypothetical protein
LKELDYLTLEIRFSPKPSVRALVLELGEKAYRNTSGISRMLAAL